MSYFASFASRAPTNQVLALAAGAGIPAVLAFLAVIIGLARTLWRRVRRSMDPSERVVIVAVVAAAAGHLVTDSFMTAEITGSWLFWTVAGGVLGMSARPRTDTVATSASHARQVQAPDQRSRASGVSALVRNRRP